MNIALIKKESYLPMPWKNGQGITWQICIHPKTARFPEDDFDWRLSSAEIQQVHTFSKFPGYERWLTMLNEGEILLNRKKLSFHEVFHFSGEEEIQCDPLGEKRTDLGFIFKKEKFNADMQIEKIKSHSKKEIKISAEEVIIYFVLRGELRTDGDQEVCAAVGDTILVTGPFCGDMKVSSGSEICEIKVASR